LLEQGVELEDLMLARLLALVVEEDEQLYSLMISLQEL
jgi:hypothetical protein